MIIDTTEQEHATIIRALETSADRLYAAGAAHEADAVITLIEKITSIEPERIEH